MSGAPQFPDPIGLREVYRPGATQHKAGPDLPRKVLALEQAALSRPGPGVANGSTITSDTSQTGGVTWSPPAAVYVYNPDYSGSASIANVTERLLDWNSEVYDYGFHAAGSSDIVVPAGYDGLYHFDAQIYFTTVPAGAHECYIAVRVYNASAALQYNFFARKAAPASMNTQPEAAISKDVYLPAGWYIRVSAWQSSGGALTLNTSSSHTSFNMHRVLDV